ncbi:hypothetical protein [Yinghuangia sp. YIM S09857]|uniref:hypothetical protein n=1 Tax=Yinghuangia sp. YIM S09857 TaxID=3436929 RepID=UPI003F5303B1
MSESADAPERPSFGVPLWRLLEHKQLSPQELADRAGLTADDIRAALAGALPSEALLRQIAPIVGFRPVDLFVLAGARIPDDLTPVDASAGRSVANFVLDAIRLPAAERRELLLLVRSLPRQPRRSPFAVELLAPHAGPGGWVVRMLQYRNLDWAGMAKLLALTTPTYLSAATYGAIGTGRMDLTSRLVTDFACLLGVDVHALAAVTGVRTAPNEAMPPPRARARGAEDAALLLWEARCLSAEQAEHVAERARVLHSGL